MSKIVVALGGNALQKNGGKSPEAQKKVATTTAEQLVQLIQDGHDLVITHGNGPQVGAILLNEEAAASGISAPLDTCSAMSQGEIGYWLQQAIANELKARGIKKSVATVVTQAIVDLHDPAFKNPTKPIGPFYPTEEKARQAAREKGFIVKEDAGRGWRRVVASPKPIDIVEKDFIASLLGNGHVVIAAGGGGIPVVERENKYIGLEAVIDKDFAAEKLAEMTDADTLLILTSIDAVSINFRQPNETDLHEIKASQMQEYIDAGQFAAGSMLPKVQAALNFVLKRQQGARSIITSPHRALDALEGKIGTTITI